MELSDCKCCVCKVRKTDVPGYVEKHLARVWVVGLSEFLPLRAISVVSLSDEKRFDGELVDKVIGPKHGCGCGC